MEPYATGEYVTTKGISDQVGWGKSTWKILKLLKKQECEMWDLIFIQVVCAREDLNKHKKKAWGSYQTAPRSGEDSDSKLEVYLSNALA